jgi:glycosyltransferase involved in cell wall biosynthesis
MKGRIKTAIISPYAPPEKGACVLRVRSFRDSFIKQGMDVEIFSPERKGAAPAKGVTRYKGVLSLAFALLKNDFDAVIGTSPPMTHSFFALLACKIRGIPFILDIRDPWTEAASALGLYGKGSLKLRLYRIIESLSYRLADRIFVVTGEIKESLEKHGVNPEKVILIGNGTDTKLFRPDRAAGMRVRRELGIPKEKAAGIYAGSFAGRELDSMLLSLSPLIRKNMLSLILLIPLDEKKSPDFLRIKEVIAAEGIGKNIFLVDSSAKGIPFSMQYRYFSAADFGIVTLQEQLGYSIPVKTYDYLACNLPVAAKGPERSALGGLFTEHNTGLYSGSWGGFSKNVSSMVKSASSRRGKGSYRAVAEKYFERKHADRKALSCINRLVKK